MILPATRSIGLIIGSKVLGVQTGADIVWHPCIYYNNGKDVLQIDGVGLLTRRMYWHSNAAKAAIQYARENVYIYVPKLAKEKLHPTVLPIDVLFWMERNRASDLRIEFGELPNCGLISWARRAENDQDASSVYVCFPNNSKRFAGDDNATYITVTTAAFIAASQYMESIGFDEVSLNLTEYIHGLRNNELTIALQELVKLSGKSDEEVREIIEIAVYANTDTNADSMDDSKSDDSEFDA